MQQYKISWVDREDYIYSEFFKNNNLVSTLEPQNDVLKKCIDKGYIDLSGTNKITKVVYNNEIRSFENENV